MAATEELPSASSLGDSLYLALAALAMMDFVTVLETTTLVLVVSAALGA
jgi:hypothetical protein